MLVASGYRWVHGSTEMTGPADLLGYAGALRVMEIRGLIARVRPYNQGGDRGLPQQVSAEAREPPARPSRPTLSDSIVKSNGRGFRYTQADRIDRLGQGAPPRDSASLCPLLSENAPIVGQRCPTSRPVQRTGRITSQALLGGLHHHYMRV
jgi:hypothetical protein